ncbi:hypothetical protein QE152_g13299 [Popillia japonica]|uniref:Uncharacterized protein n=1 Tax=Popillia japonica TaxID=7064 RepID=A0AAW1LDU3_POPJA
MSEFKLRLEKAEQLLDRFEEVQEQIENLDTTETTISEETRKDFEEEFYTVIGKARNSIIINTVSGKLDSKTKFLWETEVGENYKINKAKFEFLWETEVGENYKINKAKFEDFIEFLKKRCQILEISDKITKQPEKRFPIKRDISLSATFKGCPQQLFRLKTHMASYELADPNFFQCDKVDVLLGATEFWHVIQNGNQRLHAWLRTTPNSLKTFVANRISEIQTLTAEYKWQHINGFNNPADLLSRGMTVTELLVSELWWHGPSCILEQSCLEQKDPLVYITNEEHKQTAATFLSQEKNFILTKYSSYTKLQRIVAYCLRWKTCLLNISTLRNRQLSLKELDNAEKMLNISTLRNRQLSLKELDNAEKRIIWLTQRESFKEEQKELRSGTLNKQIFESMARQKIEWCFTPPRSPHSSDPNDLNPLTPSHFLIEGLSNCLEGTEEDSVLVAKGKAKLIPTIDPALYIHVKDATSAKEVMDKVKSLRRFWIC